MQKLKREKHIEEHTSVHAEYLFTYRTFLRTLFWNFLRDKGKTSPTRRAIFVLPIYGETLKMRI